MEKYYGRILAVGGIGLSLTSLVPAIIGARDDLELYRLLTITLGGLTALTIVVLSHSIWELSSLSRRHSDVVTEVETIRKVAFFNSTHTQSIAEQFTQLVGVQKVFEASVAAYVWRFYTQEDTEADWENVKHHWFKFIQNICDTAGYVISVKKGHPHNKCSVNIKIFSGAIGGDSSTAEYRVLARSAQSSHARREADSNLSDPKVHRNRMYSDIIDNVSHLIVDDAAAYVAETERVKTWSHPTSNVLRFYSSCLVCPIQGKDPVTRGLKVDSILDFGDASLVGLICVDAKEPAFFDEDYDLSIMTQMSDHAFGAIRALHALTGLRKRREEERKNKPTTKRRPPREA